MPAPKTVKGVNVQEMVEGYLEAAEWAEIDPDTGEELDRSESKGWDMTRGWNIAEKDCRSFLHFARTADLKACKSDSQIGHDFWLTRKGHGVGFWDRRELDKNGAGERLTKVSEKFGESIYPFVNNSGYIEFDGA